MEKSAPFAVTLLRYMEKIPVPMEQFAQDMCSERQHPRRLTLVKCNAVHHPSNVSPIVEMLKEIVASPETWSKSIMGNVKARWNVQTLAEPGISYGGLLLDTVHHSNKFKADTWNR